MADDRSELPEDRQAPSPDEPQTQIDPDGTVGDYVTLMDPDEPDTEIAEDGSLIIHIGDAYERPQHDGGFYDNLALSIPEHILSTLATDLLQKIEEDKEARKERDTQYEEGLRRTGLGKDAPGGAEFEGASRVVHPGLTEACIDYESRIIKELWPVSGPVREKIVGVVTQEKANKAKRKTEYMNFQLTTQIKEARSTMESTLTQVPLGGVQYIKQWWDHRLMRPRWQFVSVDNAYLPASASSWYSAQRRTLKDDISAITLKERVDSGMYRDLKLPNSAQAPDPSKAASANDKIEGVDPTSGMNVDGMREIYESMAYLEITPQMAEALDVEEEGMLYPYLITIDVQSKKVLALYRDWETDDPTFEPIDHIFEFQFIPWRGAQAIGLPQIAGGLSGSATGALRALLDSAHIANTQGGLILKGSGAGSQTRRAQFGEFTEIDGGGLETPDIRAKVMQFNTKEPSGVLFQLLGFLVEAQRGVVRTSMDESMLENNPNVPVGTQLSRVEEGLVVFSSIHGRCHSAFDRLLVGLHRLNRLYLPDFVRVDAQGTEIMVRRSDFEGPMDCQPASDPTIYSDQQRFAQITAIQQRSDMKPGLYDQRKVEERFLRLMKVPDGDDLLIPTPEPHELNAVNENVSMSLGRPVVAFPEQDHLAHLQTHLDFMQSPVFGANPLIAPKFLPAVLQHLVEHIVFQYAKMANDLVSGAAGQRAADLMTGGPEVKAAFDKLLAAASTYIVPEAANVFGGAMQPIQAAMQAVRALMPPPPLDPAQAALATAQAETARRGANDQAQAHLKGVDIQAKNQNDQVRNAIQAERNQIERDKINTNAGLKLTEIATETRTAEHIAAERLASGRSAGYRDGASIV